MTPRNSDAGLPDGKGLEVVAWWNESKDAVSTDPVFRHHKGVTKLVRESDATARVAASHAEIAHITASRNEWAEECGFRMAERDAALAREKVLREAGEFAVDSFDMLLQWCVKNVKMWNFPQYDNAHKDLDRLRAALNPPPAAGDSAVKGGL